MTRTPPPSGRFGPSRTAAPTGGRATPPPRARTWPGAPAEPAHRPRGTQHQGGTHHAPPSARSATPHRGGVGSHPGAPARGGSRGGTQTRPAREAAAPYRGGAAPRPPRASAPAAPSRTAAPPRRPSRPSQSPLAQARRRRAKRLKLGALDGRLRYGFAAVCTLLLVIGGRLVQLQGIDGGNYGAAAAAQRVDTIKLHALRGQILDRDGTVLAYTSAAQDVTADPTQVAPSERTAYAARLAPLLGVSTLSIVQALNEPGRYAVLATGIPPVKAQQVQALKLTGIYLQATTQRQYPGQDTASNILGTVHSDGSGASGLEAAFNSLLAGHDGSETYSVDNVGNVNPSSRTVTDPAVNGATIRLTIDQNLQYVAQQLLDQDVPLSGAEGAEMAILDVHTGQVLALASSAKFRDNLQDPPVMSAFEPGSVQKSITFAAALQEGLITPSTRINVDGSMQMGGVTVSDAWAHGVYPYYARGILAMSSNVGTLKIAQKLGPETWMRYEKLFGVGQKTGIELPGESAGYLPPMSTWSDSTFANLPFGQGESMTVLQLASIYQAIANNGVRVPPRIIQSITRPDGTVTTTAAPKGVRVVSPQTSATLRQMLESVVMPGGTGVKAAVPGYRVAGKTGTAQQPVNGVYSNWANWDTFAGMIPADDPQFVVAIMVDNPAHGVEGGDVAAPLFNQIASYEVQHAHVPPTGSLPRHESLMDCRHANPAYLPANVC